MREEKVNGHRFEFYNSIEDLPISRFHKYSKYMLVASGIGDSVADVDAHITQILNLIDTDAPKAKQELLNMRHNIVMVLQQQDLRHIGFLYFTFKVDGKVWEDFSEEGVAHLFELACGEREIEMARIEKEIRTRIDTELTDYFPQIYKGENKNLVDYLRKKTLLEIDQIVNDTDRSAEIREFEKKISNAYKPLSFEGEESAELVFDKQFEQMCLSLSKEFGGQAKKYTVMEYYVAYERLEAINKELEKIKKK
jgi:hypothetical protein